jgi:hypothetical protein
MMPWIDNTVLTLDPTFCTDFTVIRRTQVVDAGGIASVGATTELPAYGAVVPRSGNALVREEAFQAQAKTCEVITGFKLHGTSVQPSDGTQWYPDLVLWGGDVYVVRVLQDYSQMGAGVVVAECISISYQVQTVASEAQ